MKGGRVRIIDLSPPVSSETPVWPGDRAFSLTPRWSIEGSLGVNVATVTTTPHIGAHIDAPLHVRTGAPDIMAIPLDACMGWCVVVDVSDLVDRSTSPHTPAPADLVIARITEMLRAAEAPHESPPARILLRHRTEPLTEWDGETPGVDPRFIEWCAEQRVQLIGLDLLSFDPEVCAEVPAHHACVAANIVMLEGLDLSRAEPGLAELIALPIAWQGADAAPVRAILRYPQ